MTKYQELAENIVGNIGGLDNIESVTNCMTRLRFVLKDNKKVQEDHLKATPGVQGTAFKGGQYQVIIGTDVAHVTDEINKMGKFTPSDQPSADLKEEKIINRVLGAITSIFQPIIPAICGAGMLKAVLALLVFLNVLNVETQTYQLLALLADSAFYFLPVMLAVTSAQYFKANPFYAAVLGAMLIHPTFAAMVASGEPISFAGISVRAVSYGSAVVPPILIVWAMAHIERLAKKISPDPVKIFLVPLLVFLVTAPLAWIIIGPLGALVGDVLLVVFEFFNNQARWVLPVLMGAFTPFFVMTGMHYSFMPVQLAQYATLGYGTLLGPGMLASNIAQSGASLAVAMKTKDKTMKQTAFSASTTALFGITEPALYGVTMKLRTPLWVVVASGGIAGLWAGLTNMRTYASATAGILALPVYLTDDISNIINAVICIVIAFVMSFVLTMFFVNAEGKEKKSTVEANEPTVPFSDMQAVQPLRTPLEVISPLAGQRVAVSDIPDSVFANEIMGRTIAINPNAGQVIAPFDGEVVTIFPTSHAIGIKNAQGVELLIHIGIDTVELEGKGYTAFVQAGDAFKQGDVLVQFDQTFIQDKGYSTITPIVVTNTADFTDVIVHEENKDIQQGDLLLSIFQ
ncbi:beta-glucoside-specific PTS transporter subunit IIABC [Enterococcus sp.]|uniref:beta-glucoside-specific PTS transporter subunit IIABC n=1 Tax=Enterococcus sp. TaxID=35783 RepID=UPI0028A2BB03|nr:beta-glucoside-specific PTS transporter subunit IIABC [Enterococcus sp.]